MNFRPLSDRIVIEPLEPAQQTPSGIILPDQAKGRPTKGRVVGVGPGRFVADEASGVHVIACQVKVGDVVLFTQYAGSDIEDGERDLKILSECDILAVVEE